MVVVFDANSHTIQNVYEENPNGPIENPGDYAVIGWCNDWGTKTTDGTVYSAADFAATDKMTYDADAGIFTYVADRTKDFVETGKTYTFKVIKLANPTGTITADHYKEAYGDNLILVGDAAKAGQIYDALHSAHDKAFVFEIN